MKENQLHELLNQAVESERGGARIHETAVSLARSPDLRKEWEDCLDHTQRRLEAFSAACERLARKLSGAPAQELKEAHEAVEKEAAEHFHRTTGGTREHWLKSLELPAALPPPEEKKDVPTGLGAARAPQAPTEML